MRRRILKQALRISALLCLGATGIAAAQSSPAEQQMSERISQTRAELSRRQTAISEQRRDYGRQMDQLEKTLIELREKAAAAQRAKDEQLLGLDQLKNRLDKWRSQHNYQQHILDSYARQFEPRVDPGDSAEPASVLNNAIDRIEQGLAPTWKTREVIRPDGEIIPMAVTALGPVIVGLSPDGSTGGLLSRELDASLSLSKTFNDQQRQALGTLKQTGQGPLTFDPTLGSAAKIQRQNGGLIGHLAKGGVWALPILFFGALSLLISLLKGIQLVRLPRLDQSLANKVRRLAASAEHNDHETLKNVLQKAPAPQRSLARIASQTPPSAHRDDQFVAYLMDYRHRIERFMGVVATSAAISPLLGLLGTVSGMISTFKMMTIFGSGDAATVSGGISEALVTTELGLIVAIPSLIVSALLSRRTKSYAHALESFAISLSKIDLGGHRHKGGRT